MTTETAGLRRTLTNLPHQLLIDKPDAGCAEIRKNYLHPTSRLSVEIFFEVDAAKSLITLVLAICVVRYCRPRDRYRQMA